MGPDIEERRAAIVRALTGMADTAPPPVPPAPPDAAWIDDVSRRIEARLVALVEQSSTDMAARLDGLEQRVASLATDVDGRLVGVQRAMTELQDVVVALARSGRQRSARRSRARLEAIPDVAPEEDTPHDPAQPTLDDA